MKLQIGQNYFVKDGNDNWVGELASIDGPYSITFKEGSASWVADTGRLHEFMKNGHAENMEIEPMTQEGSIVFKSIWKWPHKLFVEAV